MFFKLLCAVDPKQLRLSKHDDKIYSRFREVFPDLKIDILDEDKIKSNEAKTVSLSKSSFFYDLFVFLALEIIL